MSWNQLLSIMQESAMIAHQERTSPPMACPNDGEPLRADPKGGLRCPFDGWRWTGGSVEGQGTRNE